MSYRELDIDGKLKYMKWANGKVQYHSNRNGVSQILTVFSDGEKNLMERSGGDEEFVQNSAEEYVSQALEALERQRSH